MYREWLAVEHHRMHIMELWPEGPAKRAGLAAAKSTLESLTQTMPAGCSFCCSTCAGRRQSVLVLRVAPVFESQPPSCQQDTLAA